MRITKELSESLSKTSLQIKNRFGVKIGYSHPMGAFVEPDDDFVIYVQAEFLPEQREFTNEEHYLIENNEFEREELGIMTRIVTDFEQRTERLDNFLIDFHQWIKTGQIKIQEYRSFRNYSWKPTGDGRFDVQKKVGNCTTGYIRHLDEIQDVIIREHIESCIYG